MSTPEEPSLEDAHARARAAAPERSAVLDEPPPWEPIWKRPRTPKNDRDKKRELRKQRRRLQDAGRCRFVAGQSRWPRSRQNRIGNAAARRDARALSRVRHSTTWLRLARRAPSVSRVPPEDHPTTKPPRLARFKTG
ncbi:MULTISPECIES: hypothetical protein [unclassified Streptomyces]|uniref:hypothetical protein n=1 Tax=unclassified Streptomyces TaxID=2593676 RepID=UPI00380C7B8E